MNMPDAEPHDEPKPVAPADPDLKIHLRRATRRGFATAGVALLGGYGAWRWLATRPGQGGVVWPLRRVLEANERIALGTFQPSRLAPNFARDRAGVPRVNGTIGTTDDEVDPATWRLKVNGGALEGDRRLVSLDQIKALPRFEQTTELKCIEGWSTVVRWAGARLADLAASTGSSSRSGRPYSASKPPDDLLSYVSLATPGGVYYVGLDMPSALHPQTLLCYEMNGQPLSPDHGAPLRLVIPLKYGIKNIKQIKTLRFTDRRPADYWAERGYDYHAGH